MSYEDYVEKHYSIMREKFWTNYKSSLQHGPNIGMPQTMAPPMMSHGSMMSMMANPANFYGGHPHMVQPPKAPPSMMGMMSDQSFNHMDDSRGMHLGMYRGRGRGYYRGGGRF